MPTPLLADVRLLLVQGLNRMQGRRKPPCVAASFMMCFSVARLGTEVLHAKGPAGQTHWPRSRRWHMSCRQAVGSTVRQHQHL